MANSSKPNRKRARKSNLSERDEALMQSMMENTTWVKGIYDKIIEKYDRDFDSDEEGAQVVDMNKIKMPKHSKTAVEQGDSKVGYLSDDESNHGFYYSYNNVSIQEKDSLLNSQKGNTDLKNHK